MWPSHTYSEKDWNPITQEEALKDPSNGYRASKTFAEKAAWDFVANEKPGFDLVTMNPPMVFGPVVHHLNALDSLNTSNERIRDYIQGKVKGEKELPTTPIPIWIDVRDLALAHVKAIETSSAGGKRFFVVSSNLFSNREILDIIRKNFPEYKDQLPAEDVKGGDAPEFAKIDNERVKGLLGKPFTSFETSMVDLVNSLKNVGA
jgi:nucleoside-diphosphate-sugar epimerase